MKISDDREQVIIPQTNTDKIVLHQIISSAVLRSEMTRNGRKCWLEVSSLPECDYGHDFDDRGRIAGYAVDAIDAEFDLMDRVQYPAELYVAMTSSGYEVRYECADWQKLTVAPIV